MKNYYLLIIAAVSLIAIAALFIIPSLEKSPPVIQYVGAPTPTKKSLNINYILPEGWIYQTYYKDFTGDEQIEVYTFFKNSYQLIVGQSFTGRAACNDVPKTNLLRLNNPNLSNTLYRHQPNKENLSDDVYILEVCSAWINNDFGYGTKIGEITYTIPQNYDSKILLQMDQLVESISLQ